MSQFKLLEVLKLMKSMCNGITTTTYTSERPKSIADNKNDFIVISLPVMLYDNTIGDGYGLINSYCRFEIFVRDKDGIENTKKGVAMAEELLAKFPISNNGILLKNPRVAMKGSDEHDFHVIVIQATLILR